VCQIGFTWSIDYWVSSIWCFDCKITKSNRKTRTPKFQIGFTWSIDYWVSSIWCFDCKITKSNRKTRTPKFREWRVPPPYAAAARGARVHQRAAVQPHGRAVLQHQQAAPAGPRDGHGGGCTSSSTYNVQAVLATYWQQRSTQLTLSLKAPGFNP
jgi:hypothetical protein